MKSKLSVFIAIICLIAFASELLAQTGQRGNMIQGQRQGQGRAARVNLIDKEPAAEYLGLNADQIKKYNAEVDKIMKIYEPFLKEQAAINKKLGIPEGGLRMGRGGGRGGGGAGTTGAGNVNMEEIQALMAKQTAEMTTLAKKYEEKEKEIVKLIANIEGFLTDAQKVKFNARTFTKPTTALPQRRRR
ncbi:hypothetical protein ACFL5P_03055 [candidate division KSB1 bacterium]